MGGLKHLGRSLSLSLMCCPVLEYPCITRFDVYKGTCCMHRLASATLAQ